MNFAPEKIPPNARLILQVPGEDVVSVFKKVFSSTSKRDMMGTMVSYLTKCFN